MKRRGMAIWLLLMVLFLQTTAAMASETERYVYDQCGLLDDADALESEIRLLREQLKIDIVIVTTEDAQGVSSREYADDFYDDHDFGYNEPRGDGVLFLIDMDHREAYISTCGKAIYYFTDERIDLALDDIVAELKDADYDGACEDFLDLTEEFMTHTPDTKLSYGYRLRLMFRDRWLIMLIVAAALAGITVALMVKNQNSQKAPASLYMNPQNGFKLIAKQDQYLNEFTTSRKIPKNEGRSGGGGGGGSSTHSSSSGTTHGGGGRGF